MVSTLQTFWLLAANVLIPIAILTFASGFFPYKPFLSGLAQYDTLEYGPPPEAPFDKVIFMVVDALRSDFVYGSSSGFQYTQSLISNGAALPFTAHATSPTITMPRIKAITTGSIPSFLDVILNFAESDTSSSLATQDTWLAQMRAKKTGKMIMYGDDTWLKLFPDFFDRADGTSSFFVSDFTEVDNNVTRHVPEELEHDDWNTMILHYLGLDHIGHKAGPRSPNMIPKQKEMDGIVRQIFEAMEQKEYLKSTLLVLAGDHGMNDAGNHGGSAPGETSPALVFMSPKLRELGLNFESPAAFEEDFRYYRFVEQSDIAPTLGGLLGFPIPRNNLGAFIPEFLPLWDTNEQVPMLMRNVRQILGVISATFPSFQQDGRSDMCEESPTSVDELACQLRAISNQSRGEKLNQADYDAHFVAITKWLSKAQELMSSTASNYNVPRLVAGQIISGTALFFSLMSAWSVIASSTKASAPLLVISLTYGIMMFASSYVEEEHHFWYWSTAVWLAFIWIKSTRRQPKNSWTIAFSCLALLTLTRIARRWNQTGQKFAGSPDIAHTFFSSHRLTLWALVLLSYIGILNDLTIRAFPRFPQPVSAFFSFLLVASSAIFKLFFTYEDSPELLPDMFNFMAKMEGGNSLVVQARICFIGILISVLYTIFSGRSPAKRPHSPLNTIHTLLLLFLTTQTRATNISLLLLSSLSLHSLSLLPLTLPEIATTSLLLQYSSFFTAGGSNAISSIDLSSAYNGVSGYNVVAVGLLTFLGNWTGPVFWLSGTVLLLLRLEKTQTQTQGGGRAGKSTDRSGEGRAVWHDYLSLHTVFTTSSLVFVMAACTMLRTHLFIWTVFSPKYLYSMAWALGQHLGVNVGLGSLLFWLGGVFRR